MPSLHSESSGDGPTLVLAHGFTQTGRLWGPFGAALSVRRRVVAVDLPGHGGSADVVADLEEGGRLLVEAGGDPPVDLLGYSLGARFALHAALSNPERVRRLVLLSGTGGIEEATAREERRRRDDETAARLESDGDVEAFVAHWLGAPMFATLRAGMSGAAERATNTASGLASSLRLAGAGTQTPLWGRLGELAMPVLAVAGATDPRYAAAAQRIASTVPHGTWALIPGAGHAVHLESPAVTAVVVRRFLDEAHPTEP